VNAINFNKIVYDENRNSDYYLRLTFYSRANIFFMTAITINSLI